MQDETVPLYSYIVFSDRCTLKDINLTSGNHVVINRYDILEAVRSNITMQGCQLTNQQIDSIYNRLYPMTQVDEALKQAHMQVIQDKYINPKAQSMNTTYTIQKAEKKVCPRCGGNLILRTAKKGAHQGSKFWGCTNFPKCRYMERLSE